MPQNNLTDKEAQNYKIRSIIFLSLMIAGIASSVYFYFQVQGHHKELEKQKNRLVDKNDSLKIANVKILRQASTIVDLQEHLKQKEQLKEAIDLVQILVNKEAGTEMTTDEILQGLTKMAGAEKKKQVTYRKERADLIARLFTKGNQNGKIRENARRGLSKKYGSDLKLVTHILNYMDKNVYKTNGNQKKLDPTYKESIYQTLYLLTTLSAQSLAPEKRRIEQLFIAVKEAIPYGVNSRTKKQIDEVIAKIQAV